jgi:acyl-CoA synthetase (AMP-forming)/AMP-acid ligase II
MLTHANVGVNVSQNIHPGTSKNQMATGNKSCLISSDWLIKLQQKIECHIQDQYQEIHICLLPFFHSYGITGILNIGFDLGAKLVTLPRLDVPSYLKAIEDHKACIPLLPNINLAQSFHYYHYLFLIRL